MLTFSISIYGFC